MSAESEKYIREILKDLDVLGRTRGVESVFRDWCKMFAIAIENSLNLKGSKRWERRENDYLNIINRYKKEEQRIFPKNVFRLYELHEC